MKTEASGGIKRLSIFCGLISAAWLLIYAFLTHGIELNWLRVIVALIFFYSAGWDIVRIIDWVVKGFKNNIKKL